jgi:ABC-type lipoprotein export system ATPase subunit
VWSLFSPTVSFLTELGLLVVWVFGIWQVSKGDITVGVLTLFITYSSRFYGRLDSMSRIVSVTQKSASAAKRIFDILDHVSSCRSRPTRSSWTRSKGASTCAKSASATATGPSTAASRSTSRPGEFVGLVGHSGSGKSTLVNLICRFYDVSEGAILLDGVDIRSFAVADYRRNIGLVLQEPFLFFGTIAENIAYGKPDASREDIIAAARAAHAHEFILRLPQGYDSMVGERGQGLSGGERQRISIARALLIDPRILIMDEATSSVDSETEKEIQKALDNLVQGPHHDRHRAPPVDPAPGRPPGGARPRRGGGRGQPRRTDGARRRLLPPVRSAGAQRRHGHGRQGRAIRWPQPIRAAPRQLRQAGADGRDGVEHTGVAPVRAFPIQSPDRASRWCWATARKWPGSTTWRPAGRDPPLLRTNSKGANSCPRSAYRRVSSYATPCTWFVKTDRGDTEFTLKDEGDIRRIGAASLLVADNHGIHFLMRDMYTIDKHSGKHPRPLPL